MWGFLIKMVLKDWTENKYFRDLFKYYKANGNNVNVKKIYIIGEHLNDWYVFGYGAKIKSRYFKTKLLAMKYAKAYMRSH